MATRTAPLINLTRMGPTAKALESCSKNLDRIATALEILLAEGYNIHVSKHEPDVSGREPGIYYTDEEADAIREFKEKYGKGQREDPDEEDVLR